MNTLFLLYTDPGSGVMLLQLLLATIAGAGFYFRSFFMRLFGRNVDTSAGDDPAKSSNARK